MSSYSEKSEQIFLFLVHARAFFTNVIVRQEEFLALLVEKTFA